MRGDGKTGTQQEKGRQRRQRNNQAQGRQRCQIAGVVQKSEVRKVTGKRLWPMCQMQNLNAAKTCVQADNVPHCSKILPPVTNANDQLAAVSPAAGNPAAAQD